MEHNKSIKLRELKMTDAATIARYLSEKGMLDNMRNYIPNPYTLADGEIFIEKCLAKDNKEIVRAICVDNELIGIISIRPQTDVYSHTAELGYWLAKPYWGQGIMTYAVLNFVGYCWNQNKDLKKIYASTFESNPSSRRVLEKAGFQVEAILPYAICKSGVYMKQYLSYILHPSLVAEQT